MNPNAASDLLGLFSQLEIARNALRDADMYAARLVGWPDLDDTPNAVRVMLAELDSDIEAVLLEIAPHVARAMGEGRQEAGEADGK